MGEGEHDEELLFVMLPLIPVDVRFSECSRKKMVKFSYFVVGIRFDIWKKMK